VKQGCPLVPYFFFLMGEVFNIMIKQVTKNGEIRGILFLGKGKGTNYRPNMLMIPPSP
jgi:hypothetical protein